MTVKKKSGSWESKKHRDYKYRDKKRGFEYPFSLEQSKALLRLPCYYCTTPVAKGMDRLDNNLGYSEGNVVSCCEKCNVILSTLPYEAKMELREALRSIYKKDLLKDWKPIYMVPAGKKEEKVSAPVASFGDGSVEINDAKWIEGGEFVTKDLLSWTVFTQSLEVDPKLIEAAGEAMVSAEPDDLNELVDVDDFTDSQKCESCEDPAVGLTIDDVPLCQTCGEDLEKSSKVWPEEFEWNEEELKKGFPERCGTFSGEGGWPPGDIKVILAHDDLAKKPDVTTATIFNLEQSEKPTIELEILKLADGVTSPWEIQTQLSKSFDAREVRTAYFQLLHEGKIMINQELKVQKAAL